ncbi:MAG TPA: hypothetical protein VFW63_11480 [Acidimicrobiales bacterium]|nr:hypothetical protein [Acidimicrobiales bacterium]
MAGRRRGLERGLLFLQRRGLNQGVLGSSRGWLWVFVATWVVRRLRRAVGSEYEVVWQGEVRPGESLVVDHLTETYEGGAVRSRRRRVRAAPRS